MLERTGERLSHQQKVRAQVRARQRFEEICLEVTERRACAPRRRRSNAAVDRPAIPRRSSAGPSRRSPPRRSRPWRSPARPRRSRDCARAFPRVGCRPCPRCRGLHGARARSRADRLAVRRLARRSERELPGIGVGGVSAAQGASSRTAQLEAFRSAHSRAHPRDAGRRTADGPVAAPAPRRHGRSARRAGAGESGRLQPSSRRPRRARAAAAAATLRRRVEPVLRRASNPSPPAGLESRPASSTRP